MSHMTGKVIGKTRSGKDIFDKFAAENYGDKYTKEDHLDAQAQHQKIMSDMDPDMRYTIAGKRKYMDRANRAKSHRLAAARMDIDEKEKSNIEKALHFLDVNGFEKGFDTEKRKELSKEKEAEPDGSFPIRNTKDLKNAIRDWGRAGSKPSDKAWIKKRARALQAEDLLPDDWKKESKIEKSFEQLELDFGETLEKQK